MKLYNTQTGRRESLRSAEDSRAGRPITIYACGITPYDNPHLGHVATAIRCAVLRRSLTLLGYAVTFVQNVTDIDDKIINRAKQRGEAPDVIARRYTEEYRREQEIFGIPAGAGVKAKDRPLYGLFMPDGLRASKAASSDGYGGIVLVMKRDVENRATFTAQDSLNGGFWGASPINDPKVWSLVDRYGGIDKSAKDLNDNFDGGYGWGEGYAEAQIYGGVTTGDVAYVAVTDGGKLSESISNRLEELGIPIVYHNETKPFAEPSELRVKADDSDGKGDSYVLFATDGNRKLFVPSKRKDDYDFHGMISVGDGKRKRIENVSAVLKFGNWELV